ncbi:hypothetical protein ZWY2020_025220 [Hordeum vulgare]|nr:hypothetical protein ZWY2020_025220 [Hordeum vulgare]
MRDPRWVLPGTSTGTDKVEYSFLVPLQCGMLTVKKQFRLGFPIQWEKYVNFNMEQANEHTLSPEKSTEYCIEKFLCGSFANSMEHTLTGFDFRTSKESTGNADGPGLPNYVKPRIQEPFGNSGDYDNSMSNMAASEGLCNDRIGMPDESFEDPGPGDTCNGQASRADNSHEDIQTDASGQRIVSHSVDSALVNNDIDKIEEEHGPSKLGNNSVCPGTEHVLEVLNKVHHLLVRLVAKRVPQLLKSLLWISFNHMARVVKVLGQELNVFKNHMTHLPLKNLLRVQRRRSSSNTGDSRAAPGGG